MRSWLATLIFFALSMAQALVGAPQKVKSISYQEAQPLLRALEEGLPDELRLKSPGEQAAIWVQWLSNYGARTRARLVRGDEDSLVNFLLFGTSFTHDRYSYTTASSSSACRSRT